MTRPITDLLRQSLTGLRAFLLLTVILGIGYPLGVWAVGQAVLDHNADGQMLERDSTTVGSAIIGQSFTGKDQFHPRPSAGEYDALASAPSNLGPSNPELIKQIDKRRATIAAAEGVAPASVPPDALTASGSGLDPYISPEYAAIQVERVASASGLPRAVVRRLVAAHTDGRILGFLGEPKVNVLTLNLAIGSRADGAH